MAPSLRPTAAEQKGGLEELYYWIGRPWNRMWFGSPFYVVKYQKGTPRIILVSSLRIHSHFDAHHFGRGIVLTTKYPHEEKLHNIRIEKEELGPSIALGACHGQHAAAGRGGGGGVGEQNVF